MPTSLRYGLNIDRDYVLPIYQRFQSVYGALALVIHACVFYLLLFHAKSWARAVRVGYLLNQAQMLAHDIWTCFLFRGYTLLPYPINFCAGPVCTAIGGYNAMTIETAFMVQSICILLFMLLMMHQQIMPPNSHLLLSRKTLAFIVCGLYVSLSLNIVATHYAGSDPPDKEHILNVGLHIQ
ncbi:hypothetical protein PMAYCL1PPCAC_15309 [Pristionchus mayeri]|uniref:G protein-coupled receptor n=1 Tax=Pristionchus mayeri TaxID=1317129 RepID=A0AAN5CIM2_9BILA|nr:hypothetical protein PMAYCL1PPCAC_15309 [Pristionchus mayeri]